MWTGRLENFALVSGVAFTGGDRLNKFDRLAYSPDDPLFFGIQRFAHRGEHTAAGTDGDHRSSFADFVQRADRVSDFQRMHLPRTDRQHAKFYGLGRQGRLHETDKAIPVRPEI